tara:strand:+ start:298 stop:489 length:192 start_codon:yes stop_codon:yes gene_type:complete
MQKTVLNLNPTDYDFLDPYSSTEGVTFAYIPWILGGALLFGIYVAIRVRQSLKKDKEKKHLKK